MTLKEFLSLSSDMTDRGVLSYILMMLVGVPPIIFAFFASNFMYVVLLAVVNAFAIWLVYSLVKYFNR